MARWRFGRFELDTGAGELWKDGRRVPLRPQPCAALGYLVERRGQFVSRPELSRALWPDGVHVHFDHGLNSCIKQIRAALGDSRTAPRYIETLTRRGYRFVAAVTRVERRAAGDGRIRLRAMPLRALDPQGTALAEALTDDIARRLTACADRGIAVLADSAILPGVVIQAPPPDFALTGSVRTAHGRVRVSARVIDVRDGSHLWAERFDRTFDASLDAQDAIARDIVRGVLAAVGAAAAGTPPDGMASQDGKARSLRHLRRIS